MLKPRKKFTEITWCVGAKKMFEAFNWHFWIAKLLKISAHPIIRGEMKIRNRRVLEISTRGNRSGSISPNGLLTK
jgi:hypothetical protein